MNAGEGGYFGSVQFVCCCEGQKRCGSRFASVNHGNVWDTCGNAHESPSLFDDSVITRHVALAKKESEWLRRMIPCIELDSVTLRVCV